MTPFLRSIEAKRLAEHEREILSSSFHKLPKQPTGSTRRFGEVEGPTPWQTDLGERTQRVKQMRATGLTFPAIARELNITVRQAMHAVKRTPSARAPL